MFLKTKNKLIERLTMTSLDVEYMRWQIVRFCLIIMYVSHTVKEVEDMNTNELRQKDAECDAEL